MQCSVLQKKNIKNRAASLIFLSWLVYSLSYLGKVNYSANITQIIDFYGITKAQAGIVPTFFFFSYGIGQVFNGVLCKKYNIKRVVFASLFTSAAINLVIAAGTNFKIIKWLWLVNGFALSVLWPTLIRLLSEALPQNKLGTSSMVMGTAVATGTFAVYGLSSIFAAFNSFKMPFYAAGIVDIVIAVIWMFFYKKAVSGAINEKNGEDADEEKNKACAEKNQQKSKEKNLLFMTIYVLCFFAIGVNLIKDGLTTWAPSILKEEFSMSDSVSILLTLFLPVIAIFGNAGALKIHKIIPDYINQCAVTFAVIAVFICGIAVSLTLEILPFMFIGLITVSFLASSLHSLVTSIFPLLMRKDADSGLLAGVLNGFCYLGSTISSYVLGAIADNFGWSTVFLTLIGFCAVSFFVWSGYTFVKSFLGRKYFGNT